MTGEIIAEKGETLSKEKARELQKKGVSEVYLDVLENEGDRVEVKVLTNGMVDIKDFIDFDISEFDIKENVVFGVLKDILENNEGEEAIKQAIEDNLTALCPKHITIDDIFASINYFLGLPHGIRHDR